MRMIEAMYGDQEATYEKKLIDYDTCSNMGLFTKLNL